jgi:hypothetical protein
MEKIETHYYGNWDKKVILIPEPEPKRVTPIKEWAKNSFYRMNAQSADCYAFKFIGSSWEGGWDWTAHLVDESAKHIYKFDNNQFYKIITI